MLSELQVRALQGEIEKQLREQADDFAKEIAVGCEETDSTEVVCGKMIANAVAISTGICLGAVLDALINAGVVEPYSDDELRRRNFLSIKRKDE
ncbi:hypothetical protein C806_03051 [Lachnospiraceae bacterium 3-1]|nr:hypothetical protein C806_03051 [Lachnospiraceae bacterium 3-1]